MNTRTYTRTTLEPGRLYAVLEEFDVNIPNSNLSRVVIPEGHVPILDTLSIPSADHLLAVEDSPAPEWDEGNFGFWVLHAEKRIWVPNQMFMYLWPV